MKAIRTEYFNLDPLKKNIRNDLIVLGASLAAAGAVLFLQSIKYASSLPVLLEVGHHFWWEYLDIMLKSMLVWALVLGVVYAIRFVNIPFTKAGSQFWVAVTTGFALGLALPFLLTLAAGLLIYIPLGLLSLFIEQIFRYATLQFAGLAAAYLVFIWLAVGLPPILIGTFKEGKWYFKFIVLLLFLQLTLDVLQSIVSAFWIILQNSVWQTNNTALILAIFGSLLLSIMAVLWSLRGRSLLTVIYAIVGIYAASIVTGNFSDLLFHWGELPSAAVALLAPLLYLQAVKWILRDGRFAMAGLAIGLVGVLAGLLVDALLHLQIIGQGWISLLCGIAITLGFGLALGFLLGPRLTNLLAAKIRFPPAAIRYMNIGLIAGIMAGMLVGGFLPG